MDLFKIDFLTVRLIDIIDILVVAFLLYKLYTLLRGGVAINIFIGLITSVELAVPEKQGAGYCSRCKSLPANVEGKNGSNNCYCQIIGA